MFSLIRKAVTLVIVAAGSIALWESGILPNLAEKGVPSIADNVAMAQSAIKKTGQNDPKAQSDEIARTEDAETGGMKSGQRLIVWVLFVVLLPVLTAPLAGRIIDQESNAANVLMLFGYTGLDVLTAHVINLLHVTGVLSAILFLTGLLAVFAYNLWICGFVAGLRKK